jgi:hypothetical protein
MRSLIEPHDERGARKNLEVQKQRPRLDILQIELKTAFHIPIVSYFSPCTADLSQSGHAWPHASAKMPVFKAISKSRVQPERVRTWANERHVSEKDVYQLRQFVETRLAQKLADMRAPWIITSGLILALVRLLHRAKLKNSKNAVVFSRPPLQEKNRKARLNYDRCSDKNEKREYKYQKNGRRDDIDQPF